MALQAQARILQVPPQAVRISRRIDLNLPLRLLPVKLRDWESPLCARVMGCAFWTHCRKHKNGKYLSPECTSTGTTGNFLLNPEF